MQDGVVPEKPCVDKMERGHETVLPGWGCSSHKPPPPPGPSSAMLQHGDTLLALTLVTPSGDTTESTVSLMNKQNEQETPATITPTNVCTADKWATRRGCGDPTAPHSSSMETQATTLPHRHPALHHSAQDGRKLNCNVRALVGRSVLLQHPAPCSTHHLR